MTILVAGSLGAGLAHSINEIIAFRALQGLGGAGIYAIPLTVLPEITPVEIFPLMSGVSMSWLSSMPKKLLTKNVSRYQACFSQPQLSCKWLCIL